MNINISSRFQEHCQVINALQDLIPQIEELAQRMSNSLRQNGKILWMSTDGRAPPWRLARNYLFVKAWVAEV